MRYPPHAPSAPCPATRYDVSGIRCTSFSYPLSVLVVVLPAASLDRPLTTFLLTFRPIRIPHEGTRIVFVRLRCARDRRSRRNFIAERIVRVIFHAIVPLV